MRFVTGARRSLGLAVAMVFLALPISALAATTRHSATGLVLKVDRIHNEITISCDSIPGFMDAMVMSFPVRGLQSVPKLALGTRVNFVLVSKGDSGYVEDLRVQPFESLELEPEQERRLQMLEKLMKPPSAANQPLTVGQSVPDFRLLDQKREHISLGQFRGKVVAITFVYSRCPFPNYCYRLTNNFSRLAKRFRTQMGDQLVLLTIVIDPVHEQPAELSSYASIWKADPRSWHFLTGPLPEIHTIAQKFDMHFYPDEAILTHSFHTVIVDQEGKLAANVEGNNFSAKQLGDLVEAVLDRKTSASVAR